MLVQLKTQPFSFTGPRASKTGAIKTKRSGSLNISEICHQTGKTTNPAHGRSSLLTTVRSKLLSQTTGSYWRDNQMLQPLQLLQKPLRGKPPALSYSTPTHARASRKSSAPSF